jgi:integrase
MGVIVRQKTKGRGKPWWVFISHKGRRVSKKVGDKAAAEETASTIRAKIQLGDYSFDEEKPIPTFKEYADSWIKTTVPAICKEASARNYRNHLRVHILPVFGKYRVTDITRGKIKDFLLEKVNEGFGKSTVGQMKTVISGILDKALDEELIPANPTHGLGKFIKTKGLENTIDPLTADELQVLLGTAQEHFPKHYPLILLLARTGLRIGEALALKWEDIDFNGRFIEVQRTVYKGKIGSPKSGKKRKVDMSHHLTETLLELRKARERRRMPQIVVPINRAERIESKGEVSEWIFPSTADTPISVENWRPHVFNKILEKAGIRKIRIHDLRHTYATLRIAKGDNIGDVSNQLGHHAVSITLNTYYHWLPGKQKDEVDALDEMHSNAPYMHPGAELKDKNLNESV